MQPLCMSHPRLKKSRGVAVRQPESTWQSAALAAVTPATPDQLTLAIITMRSATCQPLQQNPEGTCSLYATTKKRSKPMIDGCDWRGSNAGWGNMAGHRDLAGLVRAPRINFQPRRNRITKQPQSSKAHPPKIYLILHSSSAIHGQHEPRHWTEYVICRAIDTRHGYAPFPRWNA